MRDAIGAQLATKCAPNPMLLAKPRAARHNTLVLRFWRVVLAVFVALPLWLVTSSAFAHGAPHCDIRGASTYAPPPQLQETLQSLDAGMPNDGCVFDALSPTISPGDDFYFADDAGAVPTLVAKLVVLETPRSFNVRPRYGRLALSHPRSGIKSRLRRPPRG
jgi:hypothetical protein